MVGCSSNGIEELNVDPPDSTIKKYLDDFGDSDWRKVFPAKDSLMAIGKEAIPYLLEMMKDQKKFVKLQNTADLIYSGATEYYGHGWFIPYDLDWIAIRAGWALEELTFQNFEFLENSITQVDLVQLHKDNYEEYIQTGKHGMNFERESFKKLAKSIKKAVRWWTSSQQDWTNVGAIKEALNSEDAIRQISAMQHLRYPNYETEGLTDNYFQKELKPRLLELRKSKNGEIAQEAKLLESL